MIRSSRSGSWRPRSPAPVAGAARPQDRRGRRPASAPTLPVYVERAGGGILVDVDGNQLIDFGSGIAVDVGRQRRAARRRAPCSSRSPTSPTPASWSRRTRSTSPSPRQLNELTPGDHDKRSALFNSGAEAVENAVKIARSATGRQAVVAFDHAYHGRTNLTMALTAKNMPYKHGFGPFAGEVYRVPMAYPYRWPTGPEHCADEAFEQFVSLVHAQVGEDEHRRRDHRADPGRGRLHRARRPGSWPGSPSGAPRTASCSSPTRSRPASAAPATGSPASTRASSPT